MSNKLLIPFALVGILAGAALSYVYPSLSEQQQATALKTTLAFSPARDLVQPPAPFAELLAEKQDHWQLIFMGYTSCPDICPTTLMELNLIYPQLQQVADTRVVMLTADPLRDTPEHLASYVSYFNPEFASLSLPHSQLFGLSQQLMLPYAIVAEAAGKENYAVNHSAAIAVMAPQGKLAAIFKPQRVEGQLPVLNMQTVVQDFAQLVSSYPG